MKFEQKVTPPVFTPITITIESPDELKWMIAVANTSVRQAREQSNAFTFSLNKDACKQQMTFWNGIEKYRSLVE